MGNGRGAAVDMGRRTTCIAPSGVGAHGRRRFSFDGAQAEKLVAAANSAELRTVIIRCTGLYGERDPHHVPNIIKAARSGQLLVRLGRYLLVVDEGGKVSLGLSCFCFLSSCLPPLSRLASPSTVFQHCYVVNTAHAHVCAAHALRHTPSTVGGKAYIIIDGPATNFWWGRRPGSSAARPPRLLLLTLPLVHPIRDFFAPFVRAAGVWMPPRWLSLPGWLVGGG